MEDEITELRDELARADTSVESLRKSKTELNVRVGELKGEKQRCSEELAATRIELGKVKADPERLRCVPCVCGRDVVRLCVSPVVRVSSRSVSCTAV